MTISPQNRSKQIHDESAVRSGLVPVVLPRLGQNVQVAKREIGGRDFYTLSNPGKDLQPVNLSASQYLLVQLLKDAHSYEQLVMVARRAGISIAVDVVERFVEGLRKRELVEEPPTSDTQNSAGGWSASDRPRLRPDVLLQKAMIGSSPVNHLQAPGSGSVCVLYDVELALAKLMDGTRDMNDLVEAGRATGLPVTLAQLGSFIRQLAAYNLTEVVPAIEPVAMPLSAVMAGLEHETSFDPDGPEPSLGVDESSSALHSALALLAEGDIDAAKAKLSAIVDADPSREDARQLLEGLVAPEVRRRNGRAASSAPIAGPEPSTAAAPVPSAEAPAEPTGKADASVEPTAPPVAAANPALAAALPTTSSDGPVPLPGPARSPSATRLRVRGLLRRQPARAAAAAALAMVVGLVPVPVTYVRTGLVSRAPEDTVRMPTEGRLVGFTAVPGQAVVRGQVLARLDDSALRRELTRADAARAAAEELLARVEEKVPAEELARAARLASRRSRRVAQLEAKLARVRKMRRRGEAAALQTKLTEARAARSQAREELALLERAGTPAAIAAQEAEVARVRAQAEAVRRRLSELEVKAPRDGTVAPKSPALVPGTQLRAGSPLVLLEGAHLLGVHLPAHHEWDLHVGKAVAARAKDGRVVPGTVASVTPESSGELWVRVRLTDASGFAPDEKLELLVPASSRSVLRVAVDRLR